MPEIECQVLIEGHDKTVGTFEFVNAPVAGELLFLMLATGTRAVFRVERVLDIPSSERKDNASVRLIVSEDVKLADADRT